MGCVVAQCGQSACTCWWITSVGWKKREKYLPVIWMYMSPNLSKISPFFQTPTSFPFVSRVLFFITIFKPKFPSIQSCTPFSAEQFFLKHWCFSTIQRQLHTFQWQGTVQYRPCTTPHAHRTLTTRSLHARYTVHTKRWTIYMKRYTLCLLQIKRDFNRGALLVVVGGVMVGTRPEWLKNVLREEARSANCSWFRHQFAWSAFFIVSIRPVH